MRRNTHTVFGLQTVVIDWGSNVEQFYCNTGWRRTVARLHEYLRLWKWFHVESEEWCRVRLVASNWFLLVFFIIFVLCWGLGNWVLVDREQWSLGWISMRSWSRSGEEHLELLFLFTTRLRRRSNSHNFSVWLMGLCLFVLVIFVDGYWVGSY